MREGQDIMPSSRSESEAHRQDFVHTALSARASSLGARWVDATATTCWVSHRRPVPRLSTLGRGEGQAGGEPRVDAGVKQAAPRTLECLGVKGVVESGKQVIRERVRHTRLVAVVHQSSTDQDGRDVEVGDEHKHGVCTWHDGTDTCIAP